MPLGRAQRAGRGDGPNNVDGCGFDLTGDCPAVGILDATKLEDMADQFAHAVKSLIDNGVVKDALQCCLLLNSAEESARNAGPSVEAMKRAGLQV